MSFLSSWWYNIRHGPTAEEYTEAAEMEAAAVEKLKEVLAAKQRLLELRQETKKLRKDIEHASKTVCAQPNSNQAPVETPLRKARRV